MKRKLTVIIMSLAVFLGLCIISLLGVAIYFSHSYKAENETAQNQGREYGGSTDQKGCLDESLRQFGEFKEDNFLVRLKQIHISKFTEGCLTVSRPTKDFCAGVPKQDRFLAPEQWGVEKCKAAGLNYQGPCTAIFVEVVKVCVKTK